MGGPYAVSSRVPAGWGLFLWLLYLYIATWFQGNVHFYYEERKKEKGRHLLFSMFKAVAACFVVRRQTFWESAVTKPTVCSAGLEPADQLVAAACNPAFTGTAAVFAAETP